MRKRQSEREATERCGEILEQTGLLRAANRLGGSLTLLDRKRLELARALAAGPKVLLLDEIAGGLTEAECAALVDTIRDIKGSGVAIIWIEHIVHALLAVVDRLLVLNFGRDDRRGRAARGDGVARRARDLHGHRGVARMERSAIRGAEPQEGALFALERHPRHVFGRRPRISLRSIRATMNHAPARNAELTAFYGDFQALYGVSIEVAEGETVAIIGANGAGKSTLLRSIAGLLPAEPGCDPLRRRSSIGGHRRPRSCGSASPWCRRDAGCSPR